MAIFIALFRTYPPGQVFAAIRHVHVGGFLFLALAYFLYVLLVDTTGTAWIFSRFTKRVTPRDLLAARAATYPLSIVNYGAGQAAFAYYIQRKRRIPVRDLLAVFLLIIAADLCWVVTLACVGSFLHDYHIGGIAIGPGVRCVALIAGMAILLHLAFWRLGRQQLLSHLPGWSRLMVWLETKHLVRIFREATVRDYGIIALLRLPIHVMFPVAFYFVALLFHAHVPFWQLFGSVPIVILIGTIPITPGGLGTTNAAFVEMLGTFAPGELIFAMSLLWMFANYFQKALVGLIFLARMSTDLHRATPTIPS